MRGEQKIFQWGRFCSSEGSLSIPKKFFFIFHVDELIKTNFCPHICPHFGFLPSRSGRAPLALLTSQAFPHSNFCTI